MPQFWRGGRVVEGTGLENQRSESYRGFESHPLRQEIGESRVKNMTEKDGDHLFRVLVGSAWTAMIALYMMY